MDRSDNMATTLTTEGLASPELATRVLLNQDLRGIVFIAAVLVVCAILYCCFPDAFWVTTAEPEDENETFEEYLVSAGLRSPPPEPQPATPPEVLILDGMPPADRQAFVYNCLQTEIMSQERLLGMSTTVTSGEADTTTIPHCSICLESYTVGDALGASSFCCSHVYHKRCITEWLLRETDCPLCKQRFLSLPDDSSV